MRWRVEIADIQGTQRLLGDVLRALSITLQSDAASNLLVSDQFEVLETPGDVYELASRAESIIREAAMDDPAAQLGFSVGSVIEETNDGYRKHRFMTLTAGQLDRVGCVATATVQGVGPQSEEERKRQEEEQRECEYQQVRRKAVARVVSAFRDDRARQVQRLLRGELTPQTLGHIADLVQADLGGGIKSLVPNAQLERFYRSINHPAVFGERARHIVPKVEPPPNPMALEEARTFVQELAARWMERKAGLKHHA